MNIAQGVIMALPTPLSMSDWQPIATAPLDESDILIRVYGMVVQARYSPGIWSNDTPNHAREYSGAVWVCFDDAFQLDIEEISDDTSQWDHGPVTHWQPLPAPPPAPTDTGAALDPKP
jgi:hypothetical protein